MDSKPFEPVKEGWLTLERAMFGFEARRGGQVFSFADLFALLNLSGRTMLGEINGIDAEISPDRMRFTVCDTKSRVPSKFFTLDEIAALTTTDGYLDHLKAPVFEGVGINQTMLSRLIITMSYMLQRLREGAQSGYAHIFARIGSPLESRLTQIPPDVFEAFAPRNFRAGFAEAVDGSRLFSIHIAPVREGAAALPQSSTLPPKQANIARFIVAQHGGEWPDSSWKALLRQYEEWSRVQKIEETSVSRSLAAALKQRFPNGFSLNPRPIDKTGR